MRTGIHSVSKPRAQSRTGSCWHHWPVWTTPGNWLALRLSSCLDSHTTWTRGMRLQCSFPLLPLFHAAPSCVRTQQDHAPNHRAIVPQTTRLCPKPQLNSRWFSPSCKHALHQHVLENCSSAPHLPAWSRPNHVPISSWGSCELWLRVPILSIPSRSREGNSPQQTGEKSFFLLFSSLSSKTLWVRAALPLPEQYSGFGTRASTALKDTDTGNGWSGAPQTCWPVLGCHYFNHKEAVWNKAKQNQKANPSKN